MTKDNSMEWLDEILDNVVICPFDIQPCNGCLKDKEEVASEIRSHLLADVMRVLESKRDNRMFPGMGGTDHSEIRETCYQQGTNETLDKLEQAFNELLGGDNNG